MVLRIVVTTKPGTEEIELPVNSELAEVLMKKATLVAEGVYLISPYDIKYIIIDERE
jgi:hypothetical protein